MKRAILGIGIAGVLLFGSAFATSFLSTRLVESAMREVLRIEVERETGERVDALLDSRLAGLAQRALGRTDAQMDEVKAQLRQEVPQRVANVIADMTRADCGCRARLASALHFGALQRIHGLSQVRANLLGLVESAYAKVAANLLREFRIFTGSNALAFAALGAVAIVRRRATTQLLLPAIALAGAVVVVGGLYLFGQDWLHTILFGDYVGLGYAAYLSAVALLLGDVLLNHARVTTRIVNAGLHAVGALPSAVPC